MLKNVLVISSSPRAKGNSDVLCDEFVKGAISAGHTAEKVFLKGMNIGYCTNDGREFGAPSDFYLGTIAEGYDSAGFDTEFLDDAVEKSIRLAQEQQAAEDAQYNLWEQKWW